MCLVGRKTLLNQSIFFLQHMLIPSQPVLL